MSSADLVVKAEFLLRWASKSRTVRYVWEEIEAECLRTIASGTVDDSFRLSR